MVIPAALAGALLIFFVLGCNDSGESGEKPVLPADNSEVGVNGNPLNPLDNGEEIVLNLQAQLESRFIESIRIEAGEWTTTETGQQIALTFVGSGMEGVRQIEFVVEPQPIQFFDLSSSTFVAADPFVTFGTGVELMENGHGRIGAANLSGSASGQGVLGTLSLVASADFLLQSGGAHLRVRKFSLGPSSTDRDTFVDDQLNMGVVFE